MTGDTRADRRAGRDGGGMRLYSVSGHQVPPAAQRKTGGKSGRNKELKQVQGLARLCKPVGRRLGQHLKELSPD